jgi:uncharacterized membrane protein YraQ (UPF0718 family)
MALAVIWISVAVGVALGLWQRIAARTTGPIRTFAVVAAGLLVAMSLLPHAISSEGLAGLAAALASAALVPALERLFRIPFRKVNAEGLRLELGYAGLLLHRFGDGVVMGVEGHGAELSWAIGAHEIPIVALVTLAYARRGLRQALIRALLLGFASSLGFWLVRSMPGRWHELHGWVDAVAAGILVHILASEALPEALETSRQRAYDVLGAACGLLIVLAPGLDEHGDASRVAQHLLRGALEAAPFLLLGLLASAALLVWRPRAEAALTASLAPARPWPALEAIGLCLGLLGWLSALAVALAGLCLSAVTGALLRRLGPPALAAGSTPEPVLTAAPSFGGALEGLILRVGGWVGLGLLGASYIEAFVPQALAFAAPDLGSSALLVAVLALPSAVCTAGAVPIAAALLAKGLPATLAVAGLALGPALSAAAFMLARRGISARLGWSAVAAIAVCWVGLAASLPSAPAITTAALWAEPWAPVFGATARWLAAAVLGLLVARSVWRVGVRGWLGASLRAFGLGGGAEHAHAH